MTATYLASTAHLAWKVIKSYDIEPEKLFEAAHIDLDMVQCAGCRISYRSVNTLWKLITQSIQDPCMGLRSAEHWHPSYLNALGYAWLASSTLHDALNRLVRYIHIVTKSIELELVERGSETDLFISYDAPGYEFPQRCDAKLATFMAMCRVNYGEELKPVKVCLKHAPPACEEKYHQFFKAPVHFNHPGNIITFRSTDVRQSLSGANPYIAEINDNVVIEYLSHLEKNDIIQRTKAVIVEVLPSGNVSNNLVAAKLFMSVRSFQRSLRKAGATYRFLLADTRRVLAEGYINDPGIELQEVAFLLGFTEYSAFSRAFKQWTGKSPVQVRAGTLQPVMA
ncbi:MAG: AraC family transcriptional regulator [Deltaproteobacteria bacterium]|nr:AraC family transcriptional regulator [Deltaproteobacteria bacterium]